MKNTETIRKQIIDRLSEAELKTFSLTQYIKNEITSLKGQRLIDYKKMFQDAKKYATRKTYTGKCFLCGKKVKKLCKSHSIPRFILKNIAENGLIADGKETQQNFKTLFPRPGLGNAGTFYQICKECDQQYFNAYESNTIIKNLEEGDTLLLNRIALKAHLFFRHKRKLEYEMNVFFSSFSNHPQIAYNKTVNKMDLKDYNDEIKLFKTAVLNDIEKIDILYNKVLDYKSYIACQLPLAIYYDLENKIVIDIFNYDIKYKIEFIYICVFPLKLGTRIIMFKHSHSHKYKRFVSQFNKLDDVKKLKLINNLIYAYGEDFFVRASVFDSREYDVNKYFCDKVSSSFPSSLKDIATYDLFNFYE